MAKLTVTASALVLLYALFLSAAEIDPRARSGAEPGKFPIVETTISAIDQALKSGTLTCRELVEIYLDRIKTYDQPTRLNAIVVVNPDALKQADELNKEFQQTKKLRRLHGIPVIVKDNFDTKDLPTMAGSLALKGSIPPDDIFQVKKLREAGLPSRFLMGYVYLNGIWEGHAWAAAAILNGVDVWLIQSEGGRALELLKSVMSSLVVSPLWPAPDSRGTASAVR